MLVDQRAGQAVQRAAGPLVVRAGHLEGAVLGLGDHDRLSDGVGSCALGALDRDVLAVDGDVDAGRDGDRQSSDARHVSSSSRYQT
jgi:hypothetical protein